MNITLSNNQIDILYTSDMLLVSNYLHQLLSSHNLTIQSETSVSLSATGDNTSIYHFLLQLQNESTLGSYII